MTGHRNPGFRHLRGLALTLVLLGICWVLWSRVPDWVRGTPVQDLSLLIVFLAWIGVLTAGDRLWDWLSARIDGTGH